MKIRIIATLFTFLLVRPGVAPANRPAPPVVHVQPSSWAVIAGNRAVALAIATVQQHAHRTTTTPTTTRTTHHAQHVVVQPPPQPSGACETLVARVFGADADHALYVAHRESGCNQATPGACTQSRECNPTPCSTKWVGAASPWGDGREHAIGVFGFCMPMHANAFAAVGCTNWWALSCEVTAAHWLYQQEGWAPWGG